MAEEETAAQRIERRHRELIDTFDRMGRQCQELCVALQKGAGVEALDRIANVCEEGFENMQRAINYMGQQ